MRYDSEFDPPRPAAFIARFQDTADSRGATPLARRESSLLGRLEALTERVDAVVSVSRLP